MQLDWGAIQSGQGGNLVEKLVLAQSVNLIIQKDIMTELRRQHKYLKKRSNTHREKLSSNPGYREYICIFI